MRKTHTACLLGAIAAVIAAWSGWGQCLDDGAALSSGQLDFDTLFASLDDSLSTAFPAWQSRYNQENTTDPSPRFSGEDNSQNGLDDDDHLEIIAAIMDGEPVETVLGGLHPDEVAAIRLSFGSNRGKIRADLTFKVLYLVTVSILDEIERDDPEFSAWLQDMVAAYMTIGDAESLAFIRGFLITLSEIFIEEGVASGAIPSFVEGATKSAMRSAVNGNFIASRYDCYGDAPGATKPNILGDTGNANGTGENNETAYSQAGRNRQAWLIAKGVLVPPIEFVSGPLALTAAAGDEAVLSLETAGGGAGPVRYDWKWYDSAGPLYTHVGAEEDLRFPYVLPADSGAYTLIACDDAWVRLGRPATLTVTPRAFQIVEQPQDAAKPLGGDHFFAVRAAGGTALPTYQWKWGASPSALTPIPGAVHRTLELSGLRLSDAGYYQVEVTGKEEGPAVLPSRIAGLVISDNAPEISLIGPDPLYLECGEGFEEPGAEAHDDADGDITAQIVITGAVNVQASGEYMRVYTVTDSGGKEAAVTRRVLVGDTTPPEIALLGQSTVSLECGSAFEEPGVTAEDSCGEESSPNIHVTGAVETDTPGVYPLRYTASDAAGNTAETTRQVIVQDTTAPVLSLLGDSRIEVACGSVFVTPGARASDGCSGNLDAAISVTGEVLPRQPGEYRLLYRVEDSAGNAAETECIVTVEDREAPVLALIGESSLRLECGQAYVEPGVTAMDACSGDVSGRVQRTGGVQSETPGRYTLTYSVRDDSDNSASLERVVEVSDAAPPEIQLIGASLVQVECGGVFVEPGVVAADACDGDLVDRVETSGGADTAVPGLYTLVYSVRDSAGNGAEVERRVAVVDTTPPVFSPAPPEEIRLECGAPLPLPSVAAWDLCGGDVTDAISVDNPVDAAAPGAYEVVFSVSDTAGNFARASTRVYVEDTRPPSLELLGAEWALVECGAVFTDPGAVAQDECSDGLGETVIRTGAVDTSSPGEYLLRYSAADAAGNRVEIERVVAVQDQSAPLVALNGEARLSIDCGALFDDAGADAFDVCEGDLAARVEILGAVDTGKPGEYVLEYRATDAAGNRGSALRTVEVRNNCALLITAQPQGASIYLNTPYTFRIQAQGGAAPLQYTWDRDGTTVASGPEPFYTIVSAALSDTGVYGCEVSDGLTTINAAPAALAVFAPASAGHHTSDTTRDWAISLTELLRVIQFFNMDSYHCATDSEDGYGAGAGHTECHPHSSDYAPQDWDINLTELLRLIQFFNGVNRAYHAAAGTEDGFAPGAG